MAVRQATSHNATGMSRSAAGRSRMTTSEERYERLLAVQSLMARVSREIGAVLDLDQVLATVLAATRTLIEFDGAVVSLMQDGELRVAAADPPAAASPARVDSTTVIAGAVMATGEGIVTAGDLGPGIGSLICVPLMSLGEVIGTIRVTAEERNAFDDTHLVLLEGLALQVAGAIESARRYEMITQLEVLKSDFIARVSHELRTPITIMSGFVSTLLTNHERLDIDSRQRMLERVDVATARLSGLIDQLLMLSRLEAGVVAAHIESVDTARALAEAQRQAESPDDVEIISEPGLKFMTDESLLVRALGFLIDNSLKYAGSCRIVASHGQLEITDRGPGIPRQQRSQVFERFTRANENTTIPGMGIGLPMARTLLSAAGAELTIEDPADGVGTRMLIRFW
jgi:K+-sensing histidine kinase KdpD